MLSLVKMCCLVSIVCFILMLLFSSSLDLHGIIVEAATAPSPRACLMEAFHAGKRQERKVHSQWGEDGILEAMHRCIGKERSGYYVELGTQDCSECTTRYLREKGWTGLLLDGSNRDEIINLHMELITSDNVASLLRQYNVPMQFDHLTIDLDLNTFWPLSALLAKGYRTRTLIVEFNRNFDDTLSQAYATLNLPFSSTYIQSKEGQPAFCYYGASARAFTRLVGHFGYLPIAIDVQGVNMFFIHQSEVGGFSKPTQPSQVPGDTLDQDFNLEAAVNSLGKSSTLGHSMHHNCHLNAWVKVLPGVNFSSPDWTNEAPVVLLSTAYERVYGHNKSGRVFKEEKLNLNTRLQLATY